MGRPAWMDDDQEIEIGNIIYIKTRFKHYIPAKIIDKWPFGFESGDMVYGPLLDERAILALAEELKFRYKNELPTLLMNDGQERSGKSTFSILLNRIYLSPAFQDWERYESILKKPDWTLDEFLDCSPLNINNICFEKEDLRNKMRDGGFGDKTMLIEDEAGHQLFAQEWWDAVQRSLVKDLQVTAKKRQIIILNLPHFKDLTMKLRGRAAAIYCHCSMKEEEGEPNIERGFVEIRRGEPNRWDQGIYWQPYYVFKFRALKDNDWLEYNKIKDRFIKSVDEGETNTSDKKTIWLENAIYDDIEGIHGDKMSAREVGRVYDMTHPTVMKYYENSKVRKANEKTILELNKS